MMNDTYGINIPYYITPSGFNSAVFLFPGRCPGLSYHSPLGAVGSRLYLWITLTIIYKSSFIMIMNTRSFETA